MILTEIVGAIAGLEVSTGYKCKFDGYTLITDILEYASDEERTNV
jgi:hypothetical protein